MVLSARPLTSWDMRLTRGSKLWIGGQWQHVSFGDYKHKRFLEALEHGKDLGKGERPKAMCCGKLYKLDKVSAAICEKCKTVIVHDEGLNRVIKGVPYLDKAAIRRMIVDTEKDAKNLVRCSCRFEVLEARQCMSRKKVDYFDLLLACWSGSVRRETRGMTWEMISPEWSGARFRDFFLATSALGLYNSGLVPPEELVGLTGEANVVRTNDWRYIEVKEFVTNREAENDRRGETSKVSGGNQSGTMGQAQQTLHL